MPPTRHKSSTRAQQTLAFGPNSNKVTKPSVPSLAKKPPKPTEDQLLQVVSEVSTPSPLPEEATIVKSPRALAIRGQEPTKQEDAPSEVEEKAAKVPDTQVKSYWEGKEVERIAPRVHQQGLSVNEKILRHFDLSSQYGVCVPQPQPQPPYYALGIFKRGGANYGLANSPASAFLA